MGQVSGSGGANVLVLSAADHREREDETCVSLLTTCPLDRTNVVSVTLTESPAHRLERWSRHAGTGDPRQATLISTGRGDADVTAEPFAPDSPALTHEALSATPDLTTLGVKLTTALDATDDGVTHTALCFHSLTSLLQEHDPEVVYRFLHTLARKVRSQGVLAHYHMDPSLHDATTVETFKTLFDTVIRLDDGGRTVAGDASVVEFA